MIPVADEGKRNLKRKKGRTLLEEVHVDKNTTGPLLSFYLMCLIFPVSSLHSPSPVVFLRLLLFFLFFLHVAVVLKTEPESCEYQAIALSHSAALPIQWVHFNVCVGKSILFT